MTLLPLLPGLIGLLSLLRVALPAAAEIRQAIWHRTLVSQAQLDTAARSESFQVATEILCAALANTAPWSHLLTYEGTTCALYDVVVDSLAAAPEDATAPCRTRHRNVCVVEGEPMPHGATLEQDCFPALCWNRVITPDHAGTVSATCDGGFVQDKLGCVYLHEKALSWCEARQHCATLGADLAVVSASGFTILQDLLPGYGIDNVWVGVKARKWMDGRDVASDEWAPGEPNGADDDCARMILSNGKYKLADRGCSNTFVSLCMKNT